MATPQRVTRSTPRRLARENGIDVQAAVALENRADLSDHHFLPHEKTIALSKRIAAKLGVPASPLRQLSQNRRETPMIERVGRLKKKMTRGISRDALMNDPHNAPVTRPSSSKPVASSGIGKASAGITKTKPAARSKKKKKAANLKPRKWQKNAAKLRDEGVKAAHVEAKEVEASQWEVMGSLFTEEIVVEVDDEVSIKSWN